MRIPDENAAGICGLFCGTCPDYPDNCHGCYSDKVRSNCVEFPCRRLVEFSKVHIVNGICHHENIIRDLNEMKAVGVANWVAEQTSAHTCPQCGELMWWCEKPHVCKK